MRIGVVLALKRESNGYFDRLSLEKICHEPFEVYNGHFGDKEIFISISGLGKSYAAACTQFLIDRFKIDLIVNTGSCGGVCPLFNLGDLVMPVHIIEYDFKSIKLGTPIFQVNKKFLNSAEDLNIKIAVLGSADSNADTKEKKDMLHQMGISIADWEGASILKTSIRNGKDALILKVVTDTSSEKFVSEFLQNVKSFNQKLTKTALTIISNYQP